MTNVLAGVWFGSLASVVEYISGLTGGSRLIPLCPLGKSSDIGAVAEMADDFWGVSYIQKVAWFIALRILTKWMSILMKVFSIV